MEMYLVNSGVEAVLKKWVLEGAPPIGFAGGRRVGRGGFGVFDFGLGGGRIGSEVGRSSGGGGGGGGAKRRGEVRIERKWFRVRVGEQSSRESPRQSTHGGRHFDFLCEWFDLGI